MSEKKSKLRRFNALSIREKQDKLNNLLKHEVDHPLDWAAWTKITQLRAALGG